MERRRRVIGFAAKTLATIVIFWLIATEVDLASTIQAFERAEPLALLGCLLLALPLLSLDGLRWSSVMDALGHRITVRTATLYNLVGMFFVNLLPASLGSDAFRTAQMRRNGVPTGVAVSSVVIDRLCAFATLPIVIALGLPGALDLADTPTDRSLLIGVFIMSVLALSGLLVLGPMFRRLPGWPVVHALAPVAQLSRDLWRVLTNGYQSARILTSSALVHATRVVIVFSLARALDIGVSLAECFALVPLSLLIAMIPVSLASWGVREAAFIYTFGFAGVATGDALALSLMFGIFRLTIGAAGGIVWLIGRTDMYAVELKSGDRP